jgi:hypothetical protein
MRRYLIASCLVLAVFALFSATQAQADSIDSFTYTAGGNTFEWQLPSSPTILASNVIPGFSFTIPDVAFSENGILQNPAAVELRKVSFPLYLLSDPRSILVPRALLLS